MSKAAFKELIRQVTADITGRPLDGALQTWLNTQMPESGTLFKAIEAAIQQGMQDGWLCENEHRGIRYGRPFDPDAELANFSVDVVRMPEGAGPHHRHPLGEVDMIMPITPGAKFDCTPRGWMVYGPDSAHRPTITGGEAIVLYLLPDGKIDFGR